MCHITDADLVYGIKLALLAQMPPELAERLQSLIDRWEAQQCQPDQGAAAHFLSIWESDQRYALLILSQMGAQGRLALAKAIAACTELSVGEIFVAWRDAIGDVERKPDHSTHPTMLGRADYTTR